MTTKAEVCKLCSPNMKDIIDVGKLSIEDRDKVRDSIELIGTRLQCGEARMTCQPLIDLSTRVQRGKKS